MRKILLASVAASAVLAGAAHAQTVSGDVVRIGVLTDLSGVYSDFGGQGAVEAARMAVADFGGKVLGKNVEVISADHQNKADVAASKAREWYDTQGVDLITESLNSSVALAVSKVATEKKRVQIVTGAATSRLSNEDCGPFTVHYVYDTYALAQGTGAAVVKAGGDSWFFLTADYAFGHSLEKDTGDVVKAAGGKVVGAVRHPLSASDFSSFLLQAQSSGAKVVGLANAGTDTVNSIKAAFDFGLTPKQQLAGLLTLVTDVHGLGIEQAQGLYTTEAWYWDQNDATRAFAKRYFEKVKKMPNSNQAGVYSAVTNYLKAVQAANSDDSEAVMQQLKSMTINDMFTKNGKIRADGLHVHDMYLFQVKAPKDSKYPWDYYRQVSVVPGEQAFQPLTASRCPLVKKS
ncbi:MAG TPA: ABC transporter substrate-binding protein [Microvirga sp.]|jgi:branched-chain amino acid transport system substrate-binding protein|nr:ABC transporter substrate-binding protein [Microvirga sp.]